MTSTKFLPQQYNYAQSTTTTQTASLPTPAASSIVSENQLTQSTSAEQQAEAALIPELANTVTHPNVLPTSQEPAGASSLTMTDQLGAATVAKQLQNQPTGVVNTTAGANSYVQGAQAFITAHPELSLTTAVSMYNQLLLGAGANQAQVSATSAQFCVMAAATESTRGQVPLSNSLLALGAAQWNSLPPGQQINYNGQTSSFGRLITDPNLWNATRAPSASTPAGATLMAQFSSQAQTALGASTLALHTTPAPSTAASTSTSASATPATPSTTTPLAAASTVSPWTPPATTPATATLTTAYTPAVTVTTYTAATPSSLANAPAEATDLLNNLPNGDPQQASVKDFAATVKWLAALPDDQRKAQENVFDAKYPNSGLGSLLERGVQKAKSIGGDPDQAAFRAAFTTNPTLQNLPSANPQLYADLKAVTDQSDAKNITADQWTKLTNDLKGDTNANEVQQIKDELNGIFPNVGNQNQGAGDLIQKDISGAKANPSQGITNLPSVVAAGGAPKLSGTDSDSQAVNTWLQSGCPSGANGAPALTLAQFSKLVQAEADPSTGQKLKDFVAKVNPSSDMGPAAVTAAQQGGSATTIAKAYPPLSKAVPGFQDGSDKHAQTLLSVVANQTSTAQINNGQFADMAQTLVNVARQGTGANSNYANTLSSIADGQLRSQLDAAVQSYLKQYPQDTSHDGSTGSQNCWNSFNHTGKDYGYVANGYKAY